MDLLLAFAGQLFFMVSEKIRVVNTDSAIIVHLKGIRGPITIFRFFYSCERSFWLYLLPVSWIAYYSE